MTMPAQPTPNVDAREIEKFDAAATQWWDPESEFKPLHQINPLRLGWIEAHRPLEGLTVVDVGCGGGLLAEAMARARAKVLGIDLATAALQVARLHALEQGVDVDYREIAVEALAEDQPAAFDVVSCLEMLEHVPDPESVVAACARLVKPGGDVYFSTLNRNSKSWLFAIVGAEQILKLLPRGTHDHKRFIRPSELDRWCRAHGLVIEAITGLTYNPLSKHYALNSRDIDVNYMVRARRLA